MFDKAAIQQLMQSEAINSANKAIINHADAVVGLPDSFKVHDLEPYLQDRRRMRGTMATISIADFSTYTKDNKQAGSAVFVSADKMQAVAVLNLGTPDAPGHTDNRAVLSPPKTAAYTALLTIANGAGKAQLSVAEFLEDWAPLILCTNENDERVEVKKAVAAVRKLTIEGTKRIESAEQKLSASRSTFEQVAATGTETFPTLLSVVLEPYKGLQPRDFQVRVGILTGAEKPALVLRIIKHETHIEEMAEELAALVRISLEGADVPVLLGEYSVKA